MSRQLNILAVSFLTFTMMGCAHAPKTQTPSDASNASGAVSDPGATSDQNIGLDDKGSDSGKIAGLQSIHFAYDHSSLDLESRQAVGQNVEWLNKHPHIRLEIQGHCDRHGSTEYNMALGERRAKAVRDYMVNLGVDKNRLTTISYGKEKMLDSSDTDQADGINRRANFLPIPMAAQHLGTNSNSH